MLDIKRLTPLIAIVGAIALATSAPAFAQTAATSAAPAASSTASAADSAGAPAVSAAAADASAADASAPATIKDSGKLTLLSMFVNATIVVKVVIVGLVLCSILSWTILVTKMFEFGSLNRESDKFLESFRTAKSITDINRISASEEYEGNPLADMAAAASSEVELSRQAGLNVAGEHRDSTIVRVGSAVVAVQSSLARRLSNGMQFLASVGSTAPFIGLFGTVYGIMNSFIGIARDARFRAPAAAP